MALNIDPPIGTFPASGGTAIHQILNLTKTRLSFKVKSSNNDHYRVRPVYGFVESEAQTPIEIIRLDGPPRSDRFVILWAEVPAEETDPMAPFKAGAEAGEITLPVKSE